MTTYIGFANISNLFPIQPRDIPSFSKTASMTTHLSNAPSSAPLSDSATTHPLLPLNTCWQKFDSQTIEAETFLSSSLINSWNSRNKRMPRTNCCNLWCGCCESRFEQIKLSSLSSLFVVFLVYATDDYLANQIFAFIKVAITTIYN